MKSKCIKGIVLLTLLVVLQCLLGCSILISNAFDAASDKIRENRAKEDVAFQPGVHNENFVKSIIDVNGKPDKELEFKDTAPNKKILIYDRTWIGFGYKFFFFAYDKEKKEYVFWRYEYITEDSYKKAMKSEGINKYFKASWFVEALRKIIVNNENSGKHNAAYNAAIKLLEEKSEYEDLNAEAYNAAAWFLATTKDPRYRDADNAVKYALLAVEYAKKINNPVTISSYLDTLAAGYAEKGDYAKATELETEAYNIAIDKNNNVKLEDLNQFKTLVEVYKSGKSYAMWKYGEKK
jgi:hypothetical protein